MITLVLLPGLDGTGLLFADFVASLGQEFKVMVVSYPPDISKRYVELESFVRSGLPTSEPFVLLAESFSGPIGISIAASPPSGLKGLILCCTFARNPVRQLSFLGPVIGALPVAIIPVRLLGFFLLGRFSSPVLLRALAKSLALVSPSVLRARAREVLTVDVSDHLSRIKLPILYLRASEDRVVSSKSSAHVVALAPHTKVVAFDAPHFLLQVLPTPVASSVLEFTKVCHGL